MTYRNRALLDLCRDAPCVGCGAQDGTVVPAHRNEGKGIGIKTSDATCIPLCSECHAHYDNGNATKEYKRQLWERWFGRWAPQVIERLAGEGKVPAYKRPSKVLPRCA